jgi:hypothetical protein
MRDDYKATGVELSTDFEQPLISYSCWAKL